MAATAAPPGYIYRESEDGRLCIEDNIPGYSMATITWLPTEGFDGKGGTLEVPSDLARSICEGYIKYLNEKTKAYLKPTP